MKILIYILIALLVVMVLFINSACILSSRISRMEEKYNEKE
jgi:septation ring formation regulator EzrA